MDSLQTRAVRRVGEISQHRLFLSATPHNGYSQSWQALLEMLDPQRFARGVEPDPQLVQQIMVRRLKDDLVDDKGAPMFPGREARAIEVEYSAEELAGHDLLERYVHARQRARGAAAVRAGDLITLLLKKRMFSSPAAFARTLAVHRESLARTVHAHADDVPEWLAEALEWDDDPTDAEDELLDRAARLVDAPDDTEQGLLGELTGWADRRAEPADSKAQRLTDELNTLGPDARVIIFTEYRDTQIWLAGILTARGFGGDKLGLLYGGMDDAKRDRLKAAFQAAPDRDPVRILLATDTASEGIDLQEHCHRVIHYDIPFNPNRLEQRIGRVDRYGQRHKVDVAHFVGTGWQQAAPGSYTADLEFLSRVARKVAVERQDLGSVNPVLAHAVEARMLGRPVLVDPLEVNPKPSTSALKAERDLRAQAQRLRVQLARSVETLHIAPPNVRRVVDTALALAGQPALVDESEGVVAPPALRAGWQRTVANLADPLSGEPRPMTFDPRVSRGRDDIVLAHLGHPLVAQATRLLRRAIWGGRTDLNRVAAVRFTPPADLQLRGPLVTVFARMVVVGSDGSRLHEEIILAGREVPESGRGKRMDLEQHGYTELRAAIEAALDPAACRLAPDAARIRLAQRWEQLTPWLVEDIQARATRQRESLDRALQNRLRDDLGRTNSVFDQLRAMLTSALADPGYQQLSFDDLEPAERQQFERDRRSWQERLDRLEDDRADDLAELRRRYTDVRALVFPFAVALCVPDTEART